MKNMLFFIIITNYSQHIYILAYNLYICIYIYIKRERERERERVRKYVYVEDF